MPLASPAKNTVNAAPEPPSSRPTTNALPFSVVTLNARSSLLSRCSSYQRRKMPARSVASRPLQPGKALCAAAIASLVSFAPRSGTCAINSPVAGLVTPSLGAPTHSPSIRHCFFSKEGSLSCMEALLRRRLPGRKVPCDYRAMLKHTTIVFDLDGTLVDTAPDLTHALNHALGQRGHAPVTPEAIRATVGRGARAM